MKTTRWLRVMLLVGLIQAVGLWGQVSMLPESVAHAEEGETPAKAERHVYVLEFTKKIYSERSDNWADVFGDAPHRLERWILDPVSNRPRAMTPMERKKHPPSREVWDASIEGHATRFLAVKHPSGKIAYGNKSGLFVKDSSEAEPRRIVADSVFGAPDFSPNGERIVFSRKAGSGGVNLHVVEVKSEKITRLSSKKRMETCAVFTPRGKILFLARGLGPSMTFRDFRTTSMATEVREIDVEGKDERLLHSTFRSMRIEALCPDASRLAYDDGGPYEVDLYLMDLRTKTDRLIAKDATSPQWTRFSIPLEAKQNSK